MCDTALDHDRFGDDGEKGNDRVILASDKSSLSEGGVEGRTMTLLEEGVSSYTIHARAARAKGVEIGCLMMQW